MKLTGTESSKEETASNLVPAYGQRPTGNADPQSRSEVCTLTPKLHTHLLLFLLAFWRLLTLKTEHYIILDVILRFGPL